MNVNYLDLLLGVILILFGYFGLRKGLIVEVFSLLALGVGIYGAFRFSEFTAARMEGQFDVSPEHLNTIAFLVTFIVLAVVVSLLGKLIAKAVKSINLGFLDKFGGFLFGLAKGLLLCSLLIMLFDVFHLGGMIKDETKEESTLYPFVEKTVPYVYQGFGLVKDAVRERGDAETETDDASGNTDDDVEETSGGVQI